MKGSEKQVAWAQDIIKTAREYMERKIAWWTADNEKQGAPVWDDQIEAMQQVKADFEALCQRPEMDDAANVIKIRTRIDEYSFDKRAEQIRFAAIHARTRG